MITFLYPKVLLLLLLLPVLIVWYIVRGNRSYASLRIPSLFFISYRGWRVRLRHLPFILRQLSLSLFILALARPQSTGFWSKQDYMGIDIMLTMDISGSMLAMDFKPNRVEVAKEVAASFIASREHDNIGLVAFSGESFTSCPLTTDHAQLLNRLSSLYPGMIEDRTAIGLGLVTAINRLRDSQAKSKVIILLTDGSNNAGDISPQTAADLAKALDITIHTIGMGTLADVAPIPVQSIFGDTQVQNMPVDIDENTLKELSAKTGGIYFRATDNTSLQEIYKAIDKLEKSKLQTRSYRSVREEFPTYLLLGLLLLFVEFLFRHVLLRTNP